MFTFSTVLALTIMAGEGLTWNVTGAGRPSGGMRQGGRVRVGMREWLHAAQGGICPTCGGEVDAHIGSDLAHVVGSGPKRAGWVAGNIYLSHASCNVGVAREAWERGTRYGAGETRATYLARLAEATAVEGITVDVQARGYDLILTPADFARPDAIATEWPCATVGGFIAFDPNYTGKR